MGNYILGKRDFEQIKTVIQIAKSIEDIYKEFYENEVDNKEFNINNLVLACNLEKSKYEEFNLNVKKGSAWCNYILNEIPQDLINDEESLMTLNYDYRVLRRVVNNISDIMYERSVKEHVNNMKLKILDHGFVVSDGVIKRKLYFQDILGDALIMDICTSYLYFLQKCIDDKKYSDIKNYLIGSKYNIAFIIHELEKFLISNNFKIPKDLYLNSKFVADLLELNNNYYNQEKNEYAEGVAFNNIKSLLQMTDSDFDNPINKASSVLRKCIINGSFLFMSDNRIENLSCIISEYVRDYRYRPYHINDKISKCLVMDSFGSIRKNRDIPKVILLAKNK